MKDSSGSTDTLKGHPQKTLLKSIREKCLDCCGNKYSEVRECHITDCPLWPYRMGKNPFHQRKMTEEQKQAASKRLSEQ
ncbi:MAG: hypothetical protein PHX61_04000 [Alphaproteobacteria bacterium]|nr:hypothetical protein [Alphaproteobacteria bacterium]